MDILFQIALSQGRSGILYCALGVHQKLGMIGKSDTLLEMLVLMWMCSEWIMGKSDTLLKIFSDMAVL